MARTMVASTSVMRLTCVVLATVSFRAEGLDNELACKNFTYGNPQALEFYSPKFPQNYPKEITCVRTITADYGYTVRIDFRDYFHIEPPHNEGGCTSDYLEMGVDFCKLTLSQATEKHLGEWICTTIGSFSEPESDSITLVKVMEVTVQLLNHWPEVALLEINKKQEFQCSLISEQTLSPLRWMVRYPNGATVDLGAPEMVYQPSQQRWVSSISFTPQIIHRDADIFCLSEESGKYDGIKIDVFMFSPMADSFSVSPAQSGNPLNKTYKFAVFPRPEPSNIKWIVNLPTDTIVLHPGESIDDFTATDIEEVGINVYKVDLFIKEVSEDMNDQEHSLFIKVSSTKEETIPFKVDVLPKEAEDIVIPDEVIGDGDMDKTVNNGTDNNAVNGTVIGYPKVEAVNVNFKMASIEDIERILDEKLRPIQENVASLQSQVSKLQNRKPGHLPEIDDVTWKSAGAKKQYEEWSKSWDYFYDDLENLHNLPESDVKVSTQVILNNGKKHAEDNMRNILLGNQFGWDFLKEYHSNSLAMGPQDEDKIKKTLKVVQARRQNSPDSY